MKCKNEPTGTSKYLDKGHSDHLVLFFPNVKVTSHWKYESLVVRLRTAIQDMSQLQNKHCTHKLYS